MKKVLKALVVATSFGFASAQAATIDFEALPFGNLATPYTEAGATFTAVSGGDLLVTVTPNGTRGLLGSTFSPFSVIRADIAGGTSVVSVDLGDFNQDEDLLFLRVFDSSNSLLGEQTLAIDGADSSMHTLSLAFAGIAYALFGSELAPTGGSSVYADNFRFDTAVVPVPAALPLMVFGLAGLGIAARRRRTA